jgi:hypothetical protein
VLRCACQRLSKHRERGKRRRQRGSPRPWN